MVYGKALHPHLLTEWGVKAVNNFVGNHFDSSTLWGYISNEKLPNYMSF